jgi:beta-glucuronidase
VTDRDSTPFFAFGRPEAVAAPALPISNVLGRARASLGGEWRILVDPLGAGDRSPLLRGGIGLGRTPGPSELLEYGFDGAPTLRVPGDWNTQRAELFWYRGAVWYERRFAWAARPGRRALLHFGAANHKADVYLNGTLLGRHAGGFTPFAFEAGPWLRPGENLLIVKVDNLCGAEDVPTEGNDWLNYGGLTREVSLVDVPDTFVRSCGVRLAGDGGDAIEVEVALDGPDAPGREVRVAIPELGAAARAAAGEDGRARLAFAARAERWSPERPRLYELRIQAGEDAVSEPIGFRTVEVAGEEILLNGEPVYLRGVSAHEESPRHPGRAHGPEDADALLGLAKELGCNFVRLAHYPHDEHTVRAADRLGLLVWAEIPVYHGIAFASEAALAQAKAQLEEMVERDRNRASVILWSIANETPNTPARNAFLGELAKHARALDPTRLVTAALLDTASYGAMARHLGARLRGEPAQPPVVRLEDPLGEILDVIGWNEYLGWYPAPFLAPGLGVDEPRYREAELAAMPEVRIETAFGKPVLVSEFGAEALAGRRGGPLELWSEEHQARVYRAQLAMLRNEGPVRGLAPWILEDFRSPIRFRSGLQDYWNRKGLVSETGVRKLAFSVLQEEYRRIAAERARS